MTLAQPALDRIQGTMTVSAFEGRPDQASSTIGAVPGLHVLGQDAQTIAAIRSLAEPMGVTLHCQGSYDRVLQDSAAELPGCVITEWQCAEMNALTLLQQLRKNDRFIPVIVLTAEVDVRTAVALIQAGALTLIEKPCDPAELHEAILLAMATQQRYAESLSRRRETVARLANLTEQEETVLELILDGWPNKAIAAKLDVSLRTVEGRRREVFTKLGANGLAEAVRMVTFARTPVCVCSSQPANGFPRLASCAVVEGPHNGGGDIA